MYKLQSILLSKAGFSLEDAVRWLVKNGFEVKKIDATEHFWRFRQLKPEILRKQGFNKIRTKEVSQHIKFILGYKDNINAPQSASISA
jgi:hypothetical protein